MNVLKKVCQLHKKCGLEMDNYYKREYVSESSGAQVPMILR
jgi:hypothetical protein